MTRRPYDHRADPGPGTAYDVHVADILSRVAWTIDPPVTDCAIAAGTLTCDFSQLVDDESVVPQHQRRHGCRRLQPLRTPLALSAVE